MTVEERTRESLEKEHSLVLKAKISKLTELLPIGKTFSIKRVLANHGVYKGEYLYTLINQDNEPINAAYENLSYGEMVQFLWGGPNGYDIWKIRNL